MTVRGIRASAQRHRHASLYMLTAALPWLVPLASALAVCTKAGSWSPQAPRERWAQGPAHGSKKTHLSARQASRGHLGRY